MSEELKRLRDQLVRIESALCDTRPKQAVGEMVVHAIALADAMAPKKEREFHPENWAHQALVLMDDAESLIRWGSVSAESARYNKSAKAFWDVCRLLAAERDALESRLAANGADSARDAERYRWMRDWFLRDGLRMEIDPVGHIRVTTPAIVDESIDAAIAASAEKPSGD